MSAPFLEVKNLQISFDISKIPFISKWFDAVKGIDFKFSEGECLAIVGESGSGKSTTARAICGLQQYQKGEILFNGKRVSGVHQDIQMIFQDPHSSLNPRMKILDCIAEPIVVKSGKTSTDNAQIVELIEKVGLNESFLKRYPHELSGGQKQRVGIARALASKPRLLICDEPVSALDVSVQAQILNLLKELQYTDGLSMLFISHDLSVVRFIAKACLVMEKGIIVEKGETESILKNPNHVYTQSLISSIPENLKL